ncbi:MAG: ribbon-helix-helix domain-containing protein [Candidatus Thermoplasmatota archaeon]|nr:ribbon-helix-helix domain-containing protein [Candidatus Thermoplasmatota archaeon]
MTKHTAVSLPKGLHDAIKEIIERNPRLGYTSIAEFCKDAIRSKIAEMEKKNSS